jgi:hypothetical protein
LQSEIQLFFKKEDDSSIEIKIAPGLDALMQEIVEFEKIKNLVLLINIGDKKLSTGEVLDLIYEASSQVILTESAFFALSDFFTVSSSPIRGPFRVTYGTSLDGVVNRIYKRLASKEDAQRVPLSTVNSANKWTFKGITKTWLIDYLQHNPADIPTLNSKGIVNDLSYQLNESDLPRIIRLNLGKHRLSFLSGLVKSWNIENVVPIFPPWVYQAKVANYLNVDVRCKNCLAAAGINYFYNFFDFSDVKLLNTPNFGHSSYTKLRMELIDAVPAFINAPSGSSIGGGLIQQIISDFYEETVAGELSETKVAYFKSLYSPYKNASESDGIAWNVADFGNNVSHPNLISELPHSTKNIPTLESISSFNTLLGCLDYFASVDIKKANYKEIFNSRLGIIFKPKSLQEVGDLFDVTRERVRQIEKKLSKLFEQKYNIRSQLIKRLDAIRSDLTIPLTITGLSIFDKWFDGFEDRPWLLENIFSAVKVENYRVHKFDNEFIIAPGDHDFIAVTIKAVKQMIQDRIKNGLNKSDIEEFTISLIGYETPELVDTVVYEATKNITFSPGADKKVLFIGSKIAALIANILALSKTPMNCSEIAHILREKYGIEGEVNYFRNICNGSFYQYAPSTFGFVEHLNLTEQEIAEVCDFSFEFMADNGDTKQWHCDQILEQLRNDIPDLANKLDKYKLRICLENSSRFIDLGRMVFVLKQEGSIVNNIRRIEFAKFVEAILEKSETPLDKDEIYKIIERDRALGATAQIFSSGRLVSVAIGKWALMDKHLNINDLDYASIVSDIVNSLKNCNHGLSQEELVSTLSESSKTSRFFDNPYLLFSLAVKSKLCKREDIYLFLREWEGCRRVTLKDAVIYALEKVPVEGMSLKEIIAISEGYYGHTIDRLYAARIFVDNDFVYNDVLQVWKRNLP